MGIKDSLVCEVVQPVSLALTSHKANKMAQLAGAISSMTLCAGAFIQTALAASGDTGAAIAESVTSALTSFFKTIQVIGGPLCGVVIAFCLIAILASIITGNSNSIKNWRNGAIVASVVLVLLLVVPTIVSWAVGFGNDINTETTLDISNSVTTVG